MEHSKGAMDEVNENSECSWGSFHDIEEADIVLPGGQSLPPMIGKYAITPPPDLNEVDEKRFFLEYAFPVLTVRKVVIDVFRAAEQQEMRRQGMEWEDKHPGIGGRVSFDRSGFQFNEMSSLRTHEFRYQLVPDMSYIDKATLSSLSNDAKNAAYTPCVPVVVVEIMLSTSVSFDDLQTKMSRFMDAGIREGAIVDTRNDRMLIYNQGREPYLALLAPIEFASWPGLTLDCIAIREAREKRERKGRLLYLFVAIFQR